MYVTDSQILEAVRKNPGSDSGKIGAAVGLSMAAASSRLSTLFTGKSVDRKQDPSTTKIKYLYYPLPAKKTVGGVQPTPPAPAPRESVQAPVQAPVQASPASTAPAQQVIDIEGAIVNLTGLLADRIMAGVSDVVVDRIADSVIERVVHRIGNRMTSEVTASVDRAVGAALTSVEQRIASAFASGAQRIETQQKFVPAKRPRVLIVGLQGEQESAIERKFGKEFDLRFVSSDRTANPSKWKDKTHGVSHIIHMTKWGSHAAMPFISKHPGYIPLNGGVTDLENRLTELYVEITK